MPRPLRDLLTRSATAADELRELTHEARETLADVRDEGVTLRGTFWAIPVDLRLTIPRPAEPDPRTA